MESDRPDAELQPGDLCPHSGLYEVIHEGHRSPHTVVVTAGDVLPPCHQCGEAARFRLVTKSASGPARPRAKAARKRSG